MNIEKFSKVLQPSALHMRLFSLIALIGFVYFVLSGSLTEWVIACIVYTIKVTVGSVYLHRYVTHKSFKARRWFDYVGAATIVTGHGISPLMWAAQHRAHHANSDRRGDPHSPVLRGFWSVQFSSVVPKPNLALVPDLVKSAFQLHIHKYFWLYNIVFAILIFLIDPRAVLYAYLVPNLLAYNMSRLVNSLNHLWGYRRHDTKDNSRNHWFTGVFGAGEGWHNNHHHAPLNPRFGEKWWEVDLGWYLIKLIRTDRGVDAKR